MVEARRDLRGREGRHPRRCHLDRERHPFEPGAELADLVLRGTARRERRIRVARP